MLSRPISIRVLCQTPHRLRVSHNSVGLEAKLPSFSRDGGFTPRVCQPRKFACNAPPEITRFSVNLIVRHPQVPAWEQRFSRHRDGPSSVMLQPKPGQAGEITKQIAYSLP